MHRSLVGGLAGVAPETVLREDLEAKRGVGRLTEVALATNSRRRAVFEIPA
jgi:hypothetical protein